jgi:hypothetical protein
MDFFSRYDPSLLTAWEKSNTGKSAKQHPKEDISDYDATLRRESRCRMVSMRASTASSRD